MRKIVITVWVLLLCGVACIGQSSAGQIDPVIRAHSWNEGAQKKSLNIEQQLAFYQSRDSNYNIAISGSPPPTYTGPGDVVSGATEYWGLRAYNAAYATGSNPAAVICDTATFAVCTTINILSNGKFDSATAAASSSCAVACVFKTFIDQIGGNNATCASAATCAAVVFNCINSSLVCARFAGVSGSVDQPYVMTNISTPATGGATVISTHSRNAPEISGVLAGFGTAVLLNNATNTAGGQWISGTITATASDNVVHSYTSVANGASPASYLAVDGAVTTGSSTYGNINLNVIGDTSSTTGFGLNGNFAEVALYVGTNFTTTQAGNMHTNQSAFWGTP